MRAALLPALMSHETDVNRQLERALDRVGETVREAALVDWLILEHVPPYDGRYEWDLEGRELTTREWGWIKRLAGYLPLNIEDGLGDPELIAVFAAIALRRAGKVETNEVPRAFEYLSDAPFDGSAITLGNRHRGGG